MDRVSTFLTGMEGFFSRPKYDDPAAEIELRRSALLAANEYAKSIFTPELCRDYGFNLDPNIIAYNQAMFLSLKRSYGFWMVPELNNGEKAPQNAGLGPAAKYTWRKYEDERLNAHMGLTADMVKWLASSKFGEYFIIKPDRSHTLCAMIDRAK